MIQVFQLETFFNSITDVHSYPYRCLIICNPGQNNLIDMDYYFSNCVHRCYWFSREKHQQFSKHILIVFYLVCPNLKIETSGLLLPCKAESPGRENRLTNWVMVCARADKGRYTINSSNPPIYPLHGTHQVHAHTFSSGHFFVVLMVEAPPRVPPGPP